LLTFEVICPSSFGSSSIFAVSFTEENFL